MEWQAQHAPHQLVALMRCVAQVGKPWAHQHPQTPHVNLGNNQFYQMSMFRVKQDSPSLLFPDNLFLSGNWFRPKFMGNSRRLKNVEVPAFSSLLLLPRMELHRGAQPNPVLVPFNYFL